MSSGLAIAALPRAPTIDLCALLEPYLVEVIIPFSTGTVDQAVQEAATAAEILLRNTPLSTAGLATGGGVLSDDLTVTVLKASAAEAVAGLLDNKAVTPLGLSAAIQAAITALLTQPNALAAQLPNATPTQAGVPWNNNGVVSVS